MEWLKMVPAEATWASVALAGIAVIRWYVKERWRILHDLAARTRVNSELDAIRDDIGACAVRVVRTHNGNGLPDPYKPLYMSIAHESARKDQQRIERVQGVMLDGAATVVLFEILAEGRAGISPSEARPGVLKDMLLSDHVAEVDAWRLGLCHKSAFFLVLHFCDGAAECPPAQRDTAEYRNRVRSAVDTIRQALRLKHDRPSRMVGWLVRRIG